MLLKAGMSFTLTTIREEEDSGAVESDTDDGSEADEHDNAFNCETNMASAGVLDRWEWEEFPDDLVIPDIPDHHNGPEGLKDGIKHKNGGTSQLKKWLDSIVYLHMSIEPYHLGGYKVYFNTTTKINIALGYIQEFKTYDWWENDIMTLVCFRQIRSTFHPETELSAKGDKCHQLRYLIWKINMAAKRTFHIGPKLEFDEGGVATQSCFYCIKQYNKDKPNKFCINFFALADSKHYFVAHIDVYQGINAGNIDVDEKAKYLPTTMKTIVNACIVFRKANDPR
eukprot:8020583-Ditylum_brightwellii.AAC.1